MNELCFIFFLGFNVPLVFTVFFYISGGIGGSIISTSAKELSKLSTAFPMLKMMQLQQEWQSKIYVITLALYVLSLPHTYRKKMSSLCQTATYVDFRQTPVVGSR